MPCEEGKNEGTYDWMACPDKYDILGINHAGNPPAYEKPD